MWNKQIYFIVTFFSLISFQSFSMVCVVSSSYSDMFTDNNRSQILRGAQLAAEKYKVAIDRVYHGNGSDLDLVNKINLAIKNGCKIMLGLYTSRECLIAGTFLKKSNIMAISPSCGHNKIANYYPHLLTAVPPINKYADIIAQKIRKQSHKKIYVFYQDNVFSRLFYSELKKIKGKINFIKLNENGETNNKNIDFKKIFSGQQEKAIVFTTYPLSSAAALAKLSEIDLQKISIIGSSSWVFDLRIIKPFKHIFLSAKEALTPDIIDFGRIKKSNFYKKYKEKYLIPPELLSAYSFEIYSLVFSCFKKNKSFKKIKLCILQSKSNGISSKIFFKKNSPFMNRTIKLYNLKKRIK